MFCRPRPSKVLPAVMHPAKNCVNQTFTTYEVPHIHPQHTTTVNNIQYQHKHYFPQTQSAVDSVTNQQFNCGGGPGGPGGPGPGPGGPGGPGFGPGGPGGPGFGPRPRPPFGLY
ncbi:CotD family spore coat protein [Rossellomorea sp. NS-SX7]|uniref:CotD family spore coat protein n=1 Tax=Rossellomorea sp. NS-SX7 TaxID=3463856 RepID=UPI004058D55D